MAKLFGVIPYGGDSMVGQLVKDVGHVSEGFMGSAIQSAQTEDARETEIADIITKATLTSALELDSKYPLFITAEKEKLDKYKLLRDDPSIGPEKAKYFYFAPGFLDQKNWLQEAHKWSQANPNYTKFYGTSEPEEQYQKNITSFKSQVKGKFGNNHGDNMANLFVSQEDTPIQTDTPSIDTTTQTGDTAVQAGATDQTKAVGMVPPMEARTVSQQKDRIWSIALAAADAGITGDALVQTGLLNPAELSVWNQTTGVTDFRLEALKIVKDSNIDLFQALLSGDPKAMIEAGSKISALTNMYYNQIYVPIIKQQGGNAQGYTPVTIDNKTYVPTTVKDGIVGITPDTNEVVYALSGDESGTVYVYRNEVFLKARHENGKTIVEGDKDFKKTTTSFDEKGRLLIDGEPFIPG